MLIIYLFSFMFCGNTKMKIIQHEILLLEGKTVRKVSNVHDKGFLKGILNYYESREELLIHLWVRERHSQKMPSKRQGTKVRLDK